MAIYITPPPVPKLPEIDLSQMSGRFGAMTSGQVELITEFNTAPLGFAYSKKAVPHIPNPSWPWGGVWTISSEGAGRDGRRYLTSPLLDDEIVMQFLYSTAGVLYSRMGFGSAGFIPWKTRWR